MFHILEVLCVAVRENIPVRQKHSARNSCWPTRLLQGVWVSWSDWRTFWKVERLPKLFFLGPPIFYVPRKPILANPKVFQKLVEPCLGVKIRNQYLLCGKIFPCSNTKYLWNSCGGKFDVPSPLKMPQVSSLVLLHASWCKRSRWRDNIVQIICLRKLQHSIS